MQDKSNRKPRRRLSQRPDEPGWRRHLYDVIFEAEDTAGKWFDIALLIAILASITIVSLETVPKYRTNETVLAAFGVCEWMLTILFTVEYVMRVCCVRRPLRYIFSFWGMIDLLSILPTYVTHFVGSGSQSFVILRAVRLLRVFRVLKLWRMMNEADELASALWRARNKIIVFLVVVLVAVTISGTLMYHIETLTKDGIDQESKFTSIPQAMYWAIVTMTTVGYGDVVPQTAAGKVISSVLILLGYSLIIVPSTFVSAEIVQQANRGNTIICPTCGARDVREDATYCYRCGARLE